MVSLHPHLRLGPIFPKNSGKQFPTKIGSPFINFNFINTLRLEGPTSIEEMLLDKTNLMSHLKSSSLSVEIHKSSSLKPFSLSLNAVWLIWHLWSNSKNIFFTAFRREKQLTKDYSSCFGGGNHLTAGLFFGKAKIILKIFYMVGIRKAFFPWVLIFLPLSFFFGGQKTSLI